jgi:pyridoxamine 5'-phosphate oxidase
LLTILLTWTHLSTAGDAKIHGVSDPGAMRRSYLLGQLCEEKLAPDWYAQLRSWFDEAAASGLVGEANAIQLATVTPEGHPAVRTVLVKGLDERGIVFYTNQESAKARDLANQPYAAAVFAWLPLERQVRLAGPVAIVTRAETEAYFASRPRGSQIGAWASPQSEVVASRAELDEKVREVEERFADAGVPAPPFWGGYRISPDVVEFWQGRTDRMHDRLRYRRVEDGWTIERLAP